ncbi:response regulator transcription factor [Sphingosinicella sp. CPCC 101087]|uniref:LuxR C-terminal-related transcriptional regulator n=1 Tax=Sphingosinicella sp. CPCC 101087 TaxID=2497754 RepID=UPI00198072E4|nr:response regulator transcription factor [Sphingosinicella sp. CPCC 101087]
MADHLPLNRAGLSSLLHEHVRTSAAIEAASFDGIVAALTRDDRVDLIATALELPGMNGTTGIRYIRVHYPRTRLVVMAGDPTRESVLECLSAGVHGYVPKSLGREEMVAAFQSIFGGQIYVPSLMTELAGERAAPVAGGVIPAFELTQRQREVLVLLSDGKSNKEIARILTISEGTVKAHINSAFRILGVHNRTSAVAALHRLELSKGSGEPPLPGLFDPRRRTTDF